MSSQVERVAARIVRMIAPRRHRLTIEYKLYVLSDAREQELFCLDRFVEPGSSVVDAGANLGVYSYALSRLARKVHSVEPNPALAQVLIDAELPNVVVHVAALGSKRGVHPLYIPETSAGRQTGWGSLSPKRFSDASSYASIQVKTFPLDDLELTDVSFIKIDVEGHELEVLTGAEMTISASRPVVLAEVDSDHRAAAIAAMHRHDYRACSLMSVCGRRATPANLLFLPKWSPRIS